MDLNIPLPTSVEAKGLLAMITLRGSRITGITKVKSIHMHLKI